MQLQDNLSGEFDHFSTNYTHDMMRFVPHYKALILAIVDQLPDGLSAERILDLGCGNGNCTALLLSRFLDATYTLVDASTEMIRISKERFPISKMQYRQIYFQDLQFETGQFDLVVAGFSLHHLKASEKQNIFSGIYQWLVPKGVFSYADLMIDRDNDDIHPAFLLAWEQYAKNKQTSPSEWDWIMEHYRTYDFPDDAHQQLQWLKAAGFNKAQILMQKDLYWTTILAEK